MKSIFHKPKLIAMAAGALLLPSIGAQAANFTFSNGDLILGFQATGGTGATQNVFFNLGPGTAVRDNSNIGFVANLNTDLENVFGSNWFNRTDVYYGVFGNLNPNPLPPAIGSAAPVNGDPTRTIYASRAATGVNTSLPINSTNNFNGTAGTAFSGMEAMVATLTATASGAAILDQSLQPVEWNNGWSTWNPTPGAAFTTFTGGIQNSFGLGGTATYLDVQRILATTTGASPGGTVGVGHWVTTVQISSNGDIALIPEPSSLGLLGVAAAFALLRRRKKPRQN